MSRNHLDPLEQFAGATDREHPPVFVGRQEIIQTIRNDLQRRIQNWRAGKKRAWDSGTFLLQGAPGAGKTALLFHLEETLPKQVHGNLQLKKGIRICKPDLEDLPDKNAYRKKLAEALLPGSREKMETREQTRKAGGITAHLFRLGLHKQHEKNILTWETFLDQSKEDPSRLHPVLLCVDEIQNTPGKKAVPLPESYYSCTRPKTRTMHYPKKWMGMNSLKRE